MAHTRQLQMEDWIWNQFLFKGKFPAQVKFKIFNDCLPLPENAFRVAIRDNYQGGSKFRQELNSKQAHALISLFRPINQSERTYAALLPDVARASSFLCPTREGGFHPTTYGVQRSHASSLHMQSKQEVPYPLYNKYVVETLMACVHPSIDPRHVVQNASLPHHANSYYSAAGHEPYLPEQPFLPHQDTYRRHRVTLVEETVPRDQAFAYGSEYGIPQFLKERDRDIAPYPHSDYVAESYSRELPTAAASYVMLESHSFAPSYERPVTHQPYYPVTTHQDQSWEYADPLQRPLPGSSNSVEANVPISSHFSFTGASRYH